MPAPQLPPYSLPHVGLTQFYFGFTPWGKRVFVALWCLLAVGLGLTVYFYYHPTQAVVQVTPALQTSWQPVNLGQVTAGYRTFSLPGQACASLLNYAATPIAVSGGLLLVFALLQAAGWSALLAGTSRLRGPILYAFYFLQAYALYRMEAYQLFFTQDPYALASLGIILVFLLPAYLFNNRMPALGLPGQVLVFMLLYAALYLKAYTAQGWAGLHRVVVLAFPALALVMVLTFIYTSRDLVNLVVAACTNARLASARQSFGRVVVLLVALVAAECFIAWHEFNILPPGPAGLRPIHLFVAAALASVFMAQHFYYQVRRQLSSNFAFALLILGPCLLTTGLLLYSLASMEVLVRVQAERLIALLFAAMGLFQLVYILLHFTPYLKQRMNIFFVLLEPPPKIPVRFIVIWFLTLGFAVVIEGSTHWRTAVLFSGVEHSLLADNALLAGNTSLAKTEYTHATDIAGGDVKANYNLASLMLATPEDRIHAHQRYADAESFVPFTFARLNRGNLLLAEGHSEQAKNVWLNTHAGPPDAYLLVNLASWYQRNHRPDSAAASLQAAVELQPMPDVYAASALLYQQTGHKAAAQKSLLAARPDVNPSPYAVETAAFIYLVEDSLPVQLGHKAWALAKDTNQATTLRINLALLRLKQQEALAADELLRSLQLEFEIPEVLVAHLVAQAQLDSFMNARSRLQYLSGQYPAYAGQAAHLLGLTYWQKGAPEMAEPLLLQAAHLGYPQDSLLAAEASAGAGFIVIGAQQLQQYQRAHPQLVDAPLRAEQAAFKLALATVDSLAPLDLTPFSYTTRLLVARALQQLGRNTAALRVLTATASNKPENAQAFIHLAELKSHLGQHAGALAALAQGTQLFPTNGQLAALQVRAYLRLGRVPQAQQELLRAQQLAPQAYSTVLAAAELLIHQQQFAAAVAQLVPLCQRYPFAWDALEALAAAYLAQQEAVQAYQAVNNALQANNRNPRLWRLFARVAEAINQPADAAFARQQASSITSAWVQGRP